MMKQTRTPLLVVHREFWPGELDLPFRKDTIHTGTNKVTCKDCAEVLDWQSPPRTCRCCEATVCVKHAQKAEIHAGRRQGGGGELVTLCTYCVDSLKMPKRTALTQANTHANAAPSVPTAVHPFSAAFSKASSSTTPAGFTLIGGSTTTTTSTTSTPSPPLSSSPPLPSSSPSSSSLATPVFPPSALRHRKCHETPWRDCATLFGGTRRNPLPPGQPKATPNPRTTTTTTTMKASPPQSVRGGQGIGVTRGGGGAVHRRGEGEHPQVGVNRGGGEKEPPQIGVDGGGAEEPERGATPAAVVIQVRWCSHEKKVSFDENVLVCIFPYSERERAEGEEDQAWVTRESDGPISRRRKIRTAVVSRKLGDDDEEAMAAWSPPPLYPEEADGDGDESSTDSCTSSESIGASRSSQLDESRKEPSTLSSTGNPFLVSSKVDEKHKEESSPSTLSPVNPFSVSSKPDEKHKKPSTLSPVNPFAVSWKPDENDMEESSTLRSGNPFVEEAEGDDDLPPSRPLNTFQQKHHGDDNQLSPTSRSLNPFEQENDGDDTSSGREPSSPDSPSAFSSSSPFKHTFSAPDGGGSSEGEPSTQGSSSSSASSPSCSCSCSCSSRPSPPSSSSSSSSSSAKPEGGGDTSRSTAPFSPAGSLIFPVPQMQEGYDGWSSSPPLEGAVSTATGEAEGEGEEPASTKSSGFFASYPTMAGAMAVVGVAATVGLIVLRRHR